MEQHLLHHQLEQQLELEQDPSELAVHHYPTLR